MAPRTGNSGQLTEKRRGDRVAVLGEGSEEEPPPSPFPTGRCSGSACRPNRCCSAAAAREGTSPGTGSGAPARPSRGPSGRAGGRGPEWGLAESGLGRLGRPCSAGATRQRRSPARLAPGLPLVLRSSRKGDPLGSPRSGRQKSYLGWAGSPGVRRRVDGLGARPPGCAQEARAWGGSRRRGLLAAAPRPPLQEIRRLGRAAAGAHAQRPRRESQPRPDSASRLRGNGPPQYFRTVTW